MNIREILRYNYEGNYDYCIRCLAEIIENQDKVINKQTQLIDNLNKRLQLLEKHSKITQEVINPLIEDSIEPMSLMDRIEESQKLS